jgi:hypothetical protein
MQKIFICALVLLLSTVNGFGQDDKNLKKPEKITAEELVAKHVASIGTPEALAAVKSRVIVGQGGLSSVKGYIGSLTGPCQLASESDKLLFVMLFNSNEYPYEKAAFDGKKYSVGLPNGERTALTEFFKAKNSILEDGLFTGALSSAWPLLDIKAKKAKIEYGGLVKLGDRYVHKLKYSPRSDTVRVSLYFETETFRHLMTEYYYTVDTKLGVSSTDIQGQKDYYTLTEQFSDFKRAGELTLPFFYTVTLDIQRNSGTSIQTTPGQALPGGTRIVTPVPGRQLPAGTGSLLYTLKLAQVFYNEQIDPAVFKVS